MSLENLFVSDEQKEVELRFQDQDFKIKIKSVSWSKKNQILSRCLSYSAAGDVQFNIDRYMKDMICEIIVSAPWGETNHIFLTRLKPEFGAILEKLVPRPFDEVQVNDFFGKK